jgi:hypothetical protein
LHVVEHVVLISGVFVVVDVDVVDVDVVVVTVVVLVSGVFADVVAEDDTCLGMHNHQIHQFFVTLAVVAEDDTCLGMHNPKIHQFFVALVVVTEGVIWALANKSNTKGSAERNKILNNKSGEYFTFIKPKSLLSLILFWKETYRTIF